MYSRKNPEGIRMSKDYDKIMGIMPRLTKEELNLVRKRADELRKTRTSHTRAVSLVKNRLEETGIITAREASDLGYTDTLLPTTTFKRCIIEKTGLDIAVEKISRDTGGVENLYYVRGMRDGIEALVSMGSVAKDIVSNLDKKVSTYDLSLYLDKRKYPILNKKPDLPKLRDELIKLMAKDGYEITTSRLDFRRYA
jgi:hypothetical protein